MSRSSQQGFHGLHGAPVFCYEVEMNADTDAYLMDMRAITIPEAWSGLWYIKKHVYENTRYGNRNGKLVSLNPGTYTYLYVLTDSTLQNMGELVMEDTPFELRTHLGFVMNAYGNVLVTGLGLGCVIRGLLTNPRVEHVTCIENSPDVINLVVPYMPIEGLTIIEADALKWTAKNKQKFDCAWHDLWTNRDKGEPHLDRWHVQLMCNLKGKVNQQGAWGFDRDLKSHLLRHGFPWIG